MSRFRPALIDVSSNETFYWTFVVSIRKCGGACNIIDDLYAQICVSNKVKNINVKVI